MTLNSKLWIFCAIFMGGISWSSSTWILRVTDIYICWAAFCCDLIAQSSFQLLPERVFRNVCFDSQRMCIQRWANTHWHTYTHTLLIQFCQNKVIEHAEHFPHVSACNSFPFFPQFCCTVTYKKLSLQSEENKIWKSQYVICNPTNQTTCITNSSGQRHL